MALKFSRQDKWFIGIVTLMHIAFLLLACGYKRIYMGDSFEYIYEALNIKNYFFFYSGNPAMPVMPEYMTQRQPGYPLFLLGFYVFAVNNWAVIIAQNILSIWNVCYLRQQLTHIGYQKKYDWLLLLFVAAYPAQFINANTIAPDILLQTCSLLYFGNFILLFQRKLLRYSVWMSCWLIAGLFIKPVLYPFVYIHIIIIFLAARQHRVKLQRPLAIAVMPLCAVLLYCYANLARTGKFHFTSNQAFNAVYYYYSFFEQKYGADSANHFLANERNNIALIPAYNDRYDYANEQGLALLEQNFASYLLFHLKNSLRIFIEPGKAELDLFTGKLTYGRLYKKEQTGFYATLKNEGWAGMGAYGRDNPSIFVVMLVLAFNCFRLMGLIFFFIDRKIHWLMRLFIFVFAGYFAIAAGPIANTRYFLPVSLIVIGCAVIGFADFANKRANKKITVLA